MGCYGIGVTRTMQAVIEQSHDDNGIIWPISVAPYTVCITPLNVAPESEVMKLAEKLYADLTEQGIDAILDDRNERPGVKFKDSELVGFPIRIGLARNPWPKRRSGDQAARRRSTPRQASDALAEIAELLKA